MWAVDNSDTFESEEILVSNFLCINPEQNYQATLTIPLGTSSGNHRLRYRTNWDRDVTDPCISYSLSNSADFTLDVAARTNPSSIGVATPNTLNPGDAILLTLAVTTGSGPTSTGLTVICDLAAHIPAMQSRPTGPDDVHLSERYYLHNQKIQPSPHFNGRAGRIKSCLVSATLLIKGKEPTMNEERVKWMMSGLRRYELSGLERKFVQTAEQQFNLTGKLSEPQETILQSIYNEKTSFIQNAIFSMAFKQHEQRR